MNWAHIVGMRIVFIPLAVVLSLSLTGCFGWDEAAEHGSCEKAYPSDKAKADECYSLSKAMYDKESYRQILVTAGPVRRRRLWADGQRV
jgi:hypothetical protein